MKRIIFLLMVSIVGFSIIYSQDLNTKELSKKEKKAIEKRKREIVDSLEHKEAIAAMQKGYYVLMADRIMIKGRAYMSPTSNMNFILVQGDKAVIQLAANNGRSGLNGMGGITVEGNVTGLKGGEADKKGEITYSFGVTGPAVSAQVQITLYKDDNQAMAIVSPNFWSGTMTVYGKIVPYEGIDYEKAIKGTTIP